MRRFLSRNADAILILVVASPIIAFAIAAMVNSERHDAKCRAAGGIPVRTVCFAPGAIKHVNP